MNTLRRTSVTLRAIKKVKMNACLLWSALLCLWLRAGTAMRGTTTFLSEDRLHLFGRFCFTSGGTADLDGVWLRRLGRVLALAESTN